MEIIDDLNQNKWEKVDESALTGVKGYTIIRKQMVKPGVFKYFVREIDNEDAETIAANLDSAKGKRDPLGAVRNCEMALDNEFNIVALNIDGDCAKRK